MGELRRTARLIDYLGALRKIHPQVSPLFVEQWKEYLYGWRMEVEYVYEEPILSLNLLDEPEFVPIDQLISC